MTTTTNLYRNHNEPQIGVQIHEDGGVVTIVTSVDAQLSALAVPRVVASKLLETLAEALKYEIIQSDLGTVRFYSSDE